jgi:hypothetical protein
MSSRAKTPSATCARALTAHCSHLRRHPVGARDAAVRQLLHVPRESSDDPIERIAAAVMRAGLRCRLDASEGVELEVPQLPELANRK